ncbi:hypothetical protein EV1_003230 [Malus domestica]
MIDRGMWMTMQRRPGWPLSPLSRSCSLRLKGNNDESYKAMLWVHKMGKKTLSDAEMPERIFMFTYKDDGGIASPFVQLNSIRAIESMTKLLRQVYSKLLRDLGWFKDLLGILYVGLEDSIKLPQNKEESNALRL